MTARGGGNTDDAGAYVSEPQQIFGIKEKLNALITSFNYTIEIWYTHMKQLFIIALTLTGILGCSVLETAPVDSISKLPVVRVGDPPPQDTEYDVFYPAGFAFPVKLKTSGSLFVSEKQVESKATLAKNLYLYKYWVSYDGKTWKNSHELLDVNFGGGFDVTGLKSNIKLETK